MLKPVEVAVPASAVVAAGAGVVDPGASEYSPTGQCPSASGRPHRWLYISQGAEQAHHRVG